MGHRVKQGRSFCDTVISMKNRSSVFAILLSTVLAFQMSAQQTPPATATPSPAHEETALTRPMHIGGSVQAAGGDSLGRTFLQQRRWKGRSSIRRAGLSLGGGRRHSLTHSNRSQRRSDYGQEDRRSRRAVQVQTCDVQRQASDSRSLHRRKRRYFLALCRQSKIYTTHASPPCRMRRPTNPSSRSCQHG